MNLLTPEDAVIAHAYRSVTQGPGWHGISVFPDDPEDDHPGFEYSLGFRDLGHPEIIVLGLSQQMSHDIIGGLYERVKAGETFEDGQLDDDVLQGPYQVRFERCPPDGRPCNLTRRYYAVEELDVLQVVWPDTAGRFPDDPLFEDEFVGRQDLDKVRD